MSPAQGDVHVTFGQVIKCHYVLTCVSLHVIERAGRTLVQVAAALACLCHEVLKYICYTHAHACTTKGLLVVIDDLRE